MAVAVGRRTRDLLKAHRWLSWLLHQRWLQFALVLPTLFGFVVVILAGIFGTPIGAKNLAIVFVWIFWWALLIMLLVPFGARVWCLACPIPAPGEWLSRLSFIRWGTRRLGLGRRWPRSLRNLWPATLGFLAIALFSAVVTTRPAVTGWILLGLVVVALVTHLVFERRAFCRYLCPVGGFLGLYSMAAPVEVRRRDAATCLNCRFKSCYRGSTAESLAVGGEGGYPCPMSEFPGAPMERNNYCIMCTECVKACPYNNITVNLRPFGQDLYVERGRKLDEAFKGFVMLGSALAYSLIMLGPYGWIKDWANLSSVPEFLGYAAIFLGTTLVAAPLLHLGTSWLMRLAATGRWKEGTSLQRVFIDTSYTLVPLGLLAWVAFSISFVLPNISYIAAAVSDPFGWGWDLFGTRDVAWTPIAAGWIPYLQIPILLTGLAWALRAGLRILRQVFDEPAGALRAGVVLTVYLIALTGAFFRVYLG